MAITPITELDFQQIKSNLKTYMQSQDRFRDYDFEGSNMSVLLEILAYNTYQNAFYTNMAISEMFLDSAQLENSVISHAKELSYLPHSRRSAVATVNLIVDTGSDVPATITIPKGFKVNGRIGSKTYQFTTLAPQIIYPDGGVYQASNVQVYEGKIVEEKLTVTSNTTSFGLSNKNIDIDSVEVTVNGTSYVKKSNIFGVESSDLVFYIEPDFNRNYKIVFGQNTFGNQPAVNDVIIASYRVSSADEPNGISTFTATNQVDGYSVSVQTVSAAASGTERESVESIKRFAPKSIQVQNRAVTASDYETLLKTEFGEIQAISVYGGDELDPPRYGRVAISIDTENVDGISDINIQRYSEFLKSKTALTIEPIFFPAEFMYCDVNVKVYYSATETSRSESTIKSTVITDIVDFNDSNLNFFGATLRPSVLGTSIDAALDEILGSDIMLRAILDYNPVLGNYENPSFNFGQALDVPYKYSSSSGFANYDPSVTSTEFTYGGISCKLQDDGNGVMQIVTNTSSPSVVEVNAGTVDYSTGKVDLSQFIVSAYSGSAIKLYGTLTTKSVKCPKSKILKIREEDITVTAEAVNT